MKKFQLLSSFHLKIIAMIAMTIDHIGLFLIPLHFEIYAIFRMIGRLAYPLFSFLIVKGITNTKKPIRYITRLFAISLILDLFGYLFVSDYIGTPLLGFALCALSIYIIEKGNKYYKLFGILPITLALFSGFKFFPFKIDYGPYGIILTMLFYGAYKLSSTLVKKYYNSTLASQNEISINNLNNALSLGFLASFSIITSFCNDYINSFFNGIIIDYQFQSYAVISGIFILFYNGKRGYSKPWFKYGCYIYIFLHIGIIYLIYYLTK